MVDDIWSSYWYLATQGLNQVFNCVCSLIIHSTGEILKLIIADGFFTLLTHLLLNMTQINSAQSIWITNHWAIDTYII